MKSDFKEFLVELKEKEVSIELVGGKIQYMGPEDSITPDLLDRLKKYKPQLITYLWPDDGNLMPINPGGDLPPVFFVHGDKGNYLLQNKIPENQPLYGFFHLGSSGEKIEISSISEFAEKYIEQLNRVYPSGPLIIGGTSFGGLIAYEMACILEKSGREVLGLFLLDSGNPKVYFESPANRIIPPRSGGSLLRKYYRAIIRKSQGFSARLIHASGFKLPGFLRNRYILARYMSLSKTYHPATFGGKALLLRATENEFRSPKMGWDGLVKDMQVVDIQGNHKSLLTDPISEETFGSAVSEFIRELTLPGKLEEKNSA